MIFTKKGDLAISTNAIVVLIIAVIMLGLIIGFVTKGFGIVSNQFLQKVDQLPEPPTTSAGTPITTSELTIGKAGDQFGTKIAVFNTGAYPAEGVKPTIYCGGSDITNMIAHPAPGDTATHDTNQWQSDWLSDPVIDHSVEQVHAQSVDSKRPYTFIYLAKIKSSAPLGKQLCQVVGLLTNAGNNTDGSASHYDILVSSDVVVEVQQ